MEAWIEANIFVKQGKQGEVLVGFIKPLVKQLRNDFNITAYHFLHEPNNEIRFRVLTTDDNIGNVKGLIENLRNLPQVSDLKYPQIPYNGEKTAFGEDGWITTYKLLEAGSDFALDILDSSVRKGPQFNRIAFSHYFLNQQGFDQFSEAVEHFRCSMERILVLVQTMYIDPMQEKMNKLETRISATEKQDKIKTEIEEIKKKLSENTESLKSLETNVKSTEKLNRGSSIAHSLEEKL